MKDNQIGPVVSQILTDKQTETYYFTESLVVQLLYKVQGQTPILPNLSCFKPMPNPYGDLICFIS